MKKLIVLMSLFASSGMAQVSFDSADTESFVAKLQALNGRTGKIVKSYDKENTGKCTLELEAYEYEMGGENHSGMYVRFQDTGMYFQPSVGIDSDADVSFDGSTIITDKSSKRPGGDACGDFGGAIGYKKGITIEGKKVTIRESFRCVLDGFEKYDLQTTCQF